MTILQNCILLMLLASAAGTADNAGGNGGSNGGGNGGSNGGGNGGNNVPAGCQGGGSRGVDISCPGTRLSWLGSQRNCCETTGLCADSSCGVFGYSNSAKASCPGKWGKCDDVECVYKNGCNANANNYDGYCTNLKNHCYGTLACKPNRQCDAANLGGHLFAMLGALCVEEGGSDNFKICGLGDPIPDPDPLPSPSPDDGNFDPNAVTPQPCELCDPQYRTEACKAVEGARKGWYVADIPDCQSDLLKGIIDEYKCDQPEPGCETYVCAKNIPDTELAPLTTCSPVIIQAD